MRLRVHLLCKRLNAKAFGVHRELRIISSARRLCVLRRLRPTQIAQNSYPLYLCGLNKTLIHWELPLPNQRSLAEGKVKLSNSIAVSLL